jgi:hypothetical protein
MPRFTPANYAANLALLPAVQAVANEAGTTIAQVALAWLLQRAEHIIPIPGTTSLAHLADNMADNMAAARISLSPAQAQRLDDAVNRHTVQGARYNTATQAEIDTEEF